MKNIRGLMLVSLLMLVGCKLPTSRSFQGVSGADVYAAAVRVLESNGYTIESSDASNGLIEARSASYDGPRDGFFTQQESHLLSVSIRQDLFGEKRGRIEVLAHIYRKRPGDTTWGKELGELPPMSDKVSALWSKIDMEIRPSGGRVL